MQKNKNSSIIYGFIYVYIDRYKKKEKISIWRLYRLSNTIEFVKNNSGYITFIYTEKKPPLKKSNWPEVVDGRLEEISVIQ